MERAFNDHTISTLGSARFDQHVVGVGRFVNNPNLQGIMIRHGQQRQGYGEVKHTDGDHPATIIQKNKS